MTDTEKWEKVKGKMRGAIQEIEGSIHFLNEDRTASWCGRHEMNYMDSNHGGGGDVTCIGCIEAVLNKWYPIFEKREAAKVRGISEYMDQEITAYQSDRCPKCKSDSIGRRFINRYSQRYEQPVIYDNSSGEEWTEPNEDYSMHHDTYCCFECTYWDFYSAFEGKFYSEDKINCPVCEAERDLDFYSWDWFNGIFEFNCSECQCRYLFEAIDEGILKLKAIPTVS